MKLFSKTFDLVILDYDGVVTDLMANYPSILKRTAQRFGLSTEPVDRWVEGHTEGALKGNPRFKHGLRDIWPELCDGKVEQFYWAFREIEEGTGYPSVPGSIEAIARLKRCGVRVAVCSMNDKRAMEWKLSSAGLGQPGALDFVSTRESAGFEKPDPRILDPIFAALGVPREASLYVGDWYPDIELARNAGVEFAGVLSGGIPREAFLREGVPGDHVFGRLAELAGRAGLSA